MAGSRIPDRDRARRGLRRVSPTRRSSAPPREPLVAARFVDNAGTPTERVSAQPQRLARAASPALTTADGRVTILMPHPERVFRTVQMSWHPRRLGRGLAVDADVPQRAGVARLIADTERPGDASDSDVHLRAPAGAVDPAGASADDSEREDVAMPQIGRALRRSIALLAVVALALCSALPGWAKDPPAADKVPALPQPLTKESIRELVSRLSDDDVRKLLLDQLDRAAAATPANAKPGMGMSGMVNEHAGAMRTTLGGLEGAYNALPESLRQVRAKLTEPDGTEPLRALAGLLVAVITAGFAVEWVYRRALRRFRTRTRTDTDGDLFRAGVQTWRRIANRRRCDPRLDDRCNLGVFPRVARARAAPDHDSGYRDRGHHRAHDDALRALFARAAGAFEAAAAVRRRACTHPVVVRRHRRDRLLDRDSAVHDFSGQWRKPGDARPRFAALALRWDWRGDMDGLGGPHADR